jgi:large subunit ribosomal protein L25
MTISLTATLRDARGKKNTDLRSKGEVPAVVYGPKHEAQSISVKASEFTKILKEAGESTIITLTGVGKDADVLIHEVDVDPVTGEIRHADLYAIESGKALHLRVPLEFVGESPAVKAGAVITKVLHDIEIEALPKDLPQHITVDISGLANFHDAIHIKDLTLPTGVTVKENPEDIVAVATEVKEEVEEAPAPIDMSAIEVEKKGKTEEAEGEAAKAE